MCLFTLNEWKGPCHRSNIQISRKHFTLILINGTAFSSWPVLLGNDIYNLELEYSGNNKARIFRDVIYNPHKQNDKKTGCLLRWAIFDSLYAFLNLDLTSTEIAKDPKQTVLCNRLQGLCYNFV